MFFYLAVRLLCAKSGRSHTNKNPALGWDMFNTCRERKDHKLDVNLFDYSLVAVGCGATGNQPSGHLLVVRVS